jgi:hypothetical protein
MINHMLLARVFSREVWYKVLAMSGWQYLAPRLEDGLPDWWLHRRKAVAQTRRKSFNSLVFLTLWSMWLERNASV